MAPLSLICSNGDVSFMATQLDLLIFAYIMNIYNW